MTSLPASDPGSAIVWGSKRINSRPQSCLYLTWSGYPSNDDDDDDRYIKSIYCDFRFFSIAVNLDGLEQKSKNLHKKNYPFLYIYRVIRSRESRTRET